MVSLMNEYVKKIKLLSDEVTRGILMSALTEQSDIEKSSILIKPNRYLVDIKLTEYSIENATAVMNHFMEHTRYHYSAYFIRYNEGTMIRYRYASCKEDKEGFYCDVVIS
ncbi:MAG: hypothetical protein NC300_11240 [Bacteroidales bacterium]|nr:hypothetical protein [Clostridium sp.]MCM1204705.1 hypothetical protein [Bacteroidales bacterium]